MSASVTHCWFCVFHCWWEEKININTSFAVWLGSPDHAQLTLKIVPPTKHCHRFSFLSSWWSLLYAAKFIFLTTPPPPLPAQIRVREAPVCVCVLTLAGVRWAVPRWSLVPRDGTSCGCWAPCSPGWQESAAGWTRPPSAGSRSLQSGCGQRRKLASGDV